MTSFKIEQDRLRKIVDRDLHLSFSGCGFLGIYHVGVAAAFKEYAPDIVSRKVYGASAGSLAAACLVNDCALDVAVTSILRIATQARKRALGPFHPGFNINDIMFEDLGKMLPEDAHIRSTDRLHISVTKVKDGDNAIISKFNTREDLIKTLAGSCFIPVFSGIVPPKVDGMAMIDGGFSDNCPIVNEQTTITVCPFSGENDICPSDESFNLCVMSVSNTSMSVSPANLNRFFRILFAPHPDQLSKMCQQGFDDAIKYLQNRDLVSCLKCLSVNSTLVVSKPDDEYKDPYYEKYSDESCCDDCDIQKKMAVVASLPEYIRKPINDAADRLNQGLYNWIFRHRAMKTLAILTAPYLLPTDIAIVTAFKIYELWPFVYKTVDGTFKDLLQNLFNLIRNILGYSWPEKTAPAGQMTCQVEITEFNYNNRSPRGRTKSFTEAQSPNRLQKIRRQRRSYAGMEGSQRIVSKDNVDMFIDLDDNRERSRTSSLLQSINSLEDLPSVAQAVQLTNETLQKESVNTSSLSMELQAAVHASQTTEAVMSYYYTDEATNSIKVTEIFNLSKSEQQL